MPRNTAKLYGSINRKSVKRSVKRSAKRRTRKRSVKRSTRKRSVKRSARKRSVKLRRSVGRTKKYNKDGSTDIFVDSQRVYYGIVRGPSLLSGSYNYYGKPTIARAELERVIVDPDTFLKISDNTILYHDGEFDKLYIIRSVGSGFYFYETDIDSIGEYYDIV